jgi:hypothetical protein
MSNAKLFHWKEEFIKRSPSTFNALILYDPQNPNIHRLALPFQCQPALFQAGCIQPRLADRALAEHHLPGGRL